MGKVEDSQQAILRLLRRYTVLSVSDVVTYLHVSEATVRRHFAELENQGKLIRTHGGIRLPSGELDYRFKNKSNCFVDEKRRIGSLAAEEIADDDHIFLDSGTTTLEFGKALAGRLKKGQLRNINIFTNALNCCDILSRYCQVIMTGGIIRLERMDVHGALALQNMEQYHFTRAVMGADGISPDGTLSTTDEETANLARTAISRSRSVLVLADSSKIGQPSFVTCGRMQGEDFILVTDSGVEPKYIQRFQELGIKVLIAR